MNLPRPVCVIAVLLAAALLLASGVVGGHPTPARDAPAWTAPEARTDSATPREAALGCPPPARAVAQDV